MVLVRAGDSFLKHVLLLSHQGKINSSLPCRRKSNLNHSYHNSDMRWLSRPTCSALGELQQRSDRAGTSTYCRRASRREVLHPAATVPEPLLLLQQQPGVSLPWVSLWMFFCLCCSASRFRTYCALATVFAGTLNLLLTFVEALANRCS